MRAYLKSECRRWGALFRGLHRDRRGGVSIETVLIIAAIGTSGTISALMHGTIHWPVLLPFAAGGAVAMIAGRLLAERMAGPKLQKIFATAILAVGVGMLIDSLM